MPVTISLSQKLYEKLGAEVTKELVNWFNAVDASYLDELRRQNELNFSRFEARLVQGLAELDRHFEGRFAELVKNDRLEARLGELKADLLKWMFGFWATTTLALVALALRK